MDHYSLEEWLKYVKNELGVKEREVYEDHLYLCDQCLEVYLAAMDEADHLLPSMPGKDDFLSLIMTQIAEESNKEVPLVNETAKQKSVSAGETWFARFFSIAFVCLLLIWGLLKMLGGSKNKTENFNWE
ncbi:hypothetical protein [Cytobacillus sp. NCCP-133]|uniref:hypothetical protein n=1 Tax=Cytobacillus sp. NCCP-133 TaxID=766848 RepID=UPI00222FB154|nr:hypothetical protein [Cytobacillus sp. NCCP-133]GLB61086.1 hypothetical protein NCCP133_32160 [Cytobacillus sp. NCCP-133]